MSGDKTFVLFSGFTSSTDSRAVCPEGGLQEFLESYGDIGVTISDFGGYWKQARNIVVFQRCSARTQVAGTPK